MKDTTIGTDSLPVPGHAPQKPLFSMQVPILVTIVIEIIFVVLFRELSVFSGFSAGLAVALAIAIALVVLGIAEFFRRRGRISIKVVFALTTLCAIFIGLINRQIISTIQQKRMVHMIQANNGGITFEGYNHFEDPYWPATQSGGIFPNWLIDVVGRDLFQDVEYAYLDPPNDGDSETVKMELLLPLRTIWFRNANISDEGFQQVSKLENLEHLTFSSVEATANGIRELKKLKKLQALQLVRSVLSPEATAAIGELTQLQILVLRDSNLTFAELQQLKELQNLRYLTVNNNLLTRAELQQLRKMLPNCTVN